MVTVDDVREFLDQKWTVLLWWGDYYYHALATGENETTQHAMEQEKQLAKGCSPSEALRCLVEQMSGRPEAMMALAEVVSWVVVWDDECERVGCQTRLPQKLVDEAKAALELAKVEKKVGG